MVLVCSVAIVVAIREADFASFFAVHTGLRVALGGLRICLTTTDGSTPSGCVTALLPSSSLRRVAGPFRKVLVFSRKALVPSTDEGVGALTG